MASSITGVATQARDLLARADALARACDDAAGASDTATRARWARTAGRLGSSVVRPLRAALGVAATDAPPAPIDQLDLPAAIHDLALSATRLRVQAGGPLALQEATAALQDLACQFVANDSERLEARRTEFADVLTGMAPSIRSAPDGPYLVTNIPALSDWLGVALTPTPQAALCRCGASQLKPWCDGRMPRSASTQPNPTTASRTASTATRASESRSPTTAVPVRTPASALTAYRASFALTTSLSSPRRAAASTRSCAPPMVAHPAP